MELVFLTLLVLFMVLALMAGFPVSFALPGSAILAIGLAALSGWLFASDINAYFYQGGPIDWLSSGVTNFRSLYWDVERDTLIAIPLFVFMGIMLQRSKIAEDLLVTMAQLFGPIPGGLGVSVVFVGALLAATTGIVGATVIAMGLISLPAMLRNNYSKSLACGTICASGTLGQIIPPSIVLIILADQLSSASDQASTARKALFKDATGQLSMPSQFDITSASAGDMFMGAVIPGMVLVAIYMVYILVSATLRPNTAPPVPYDGEFDRGFALRVVLALVPPLTLIFIVLGSIILGIATVNQAGAIGAVGATIMAGYRLGGGKSNAFYPAILALLSIVGIMIVLSQYELNIKNVRDGDMLGLVLAIIFCSSLMIAVLWSTWRTYVVDDTLRGVMVETAKTTSMVFIILIGAAMLTSAFRGFGGEELVKEHLTALPGGFWTQFIVVMAVIFFLGFFLDFIEIAVVVVPIVAPILLADPSANITAVWLGVMIGLNIQTSFLTPPFGFALFYLRGVAPPSVQTLDIYRGAIAFILLQLLGLAIAGQFPSLVNYLPYRTYLTSETAPPPMNPRLQECIEEYLFKEYDVRGGVIRASLDVVRKQDLSYLPENLNRQLNESFAKAAATFERVAEVRAAQTMVDEKTQQYRPLHDKVRRLQSEMRKVDKLIAEGQIGIRRATRQATPDPQRMAAAQIRVAALQKQRDALAAQIPAQWKSEHAAFSALLERHKAALNKYRNNVDGAYEPAVKVRKQIEHLGALLKVEPLIAELQTVIANDDAKLVAARIKGVEQVLGKVDGANDIRSMLAKVRREFRGDPDAGTSSDSYREQARQLLDQAKMRFAAQVAWRSKAAGELAPGLFTYERAIADNIGLRLQERLSVAQAETVASCQAHHRDVSLNF